MSMREVGARGLGVRVFGAAVLLFTTVLCGPAWAGCEEAAGCADPSICEAGPCQASTGEGDDGGSAGRSGGYGGSSGSRASNNDLGAARTVQRLSIGAGVPGWIFFGFGTANAIAAIALATGGDFYAANAGIAFLCYGIAGPFAGASSAWARRGLEGLGKPSPSGGARGTGWALYASGLGIATIAIAVGESQDIFLAPLGGVGAATAITGTVMLLVDAAVSEDDLDDAIDDARVGVAPRRMRPQLAFAPLVVPQRDGNTAIGLQVIGRW